MLRRLILILNRVIQQPGITAHRELDAVLRSDYKWFQNPF